MMGLFILNFVLFAFHIFIECNLGRITIFQEVMTLVDSRTKQFVVTNCSKERPGSIETKTLKNGILIPIATSKESHFNAGFKYISFIKFSLTHQKLRT